METTVRTPDQLPPLLRSFRKARGLTQKALAERLGISQQAMSQLERDPQSASFGRLLALLAELQVGLVLRDDRKPKKGKPAW